MEKLVIRWSYWIGIALTVLALVARALNALAGPAVLAFTTRGSAVGYRTYLDGAVLIFLVEVGTAGYAWTKTQGPGR